MTKVFKVSKRDATMPVLWYARTRGECKGGGSCAREHLARK